MSQSNIGISLDIIDYFPSDFDYSAFSFIFISEEYNLEGEISYINSNQICHKIPLNNKKDIKYSIKVLKNDSLIGITEFIIPSQIIYKKEKIFDKTCTINMTESTKKVLFGNSNKPTALKIDIHSILQYLEGTKNNIREKKDKKDFFKKKKIIQKKDKNNSNDRLKIFTPSKNLKVDKNFPLLTSSISGVDNTINKHVVHNNSTINNQSRKAESFILEDIQKNKKDKKQKRTVSSQRQDKDFSKIKLINNNTSNKKGIKNFFKENNEKNQKNVTDNNSNNKINKDEKENINFLKNDFEHYITNNSDKLNEINDMNNMINFTNNNIKKLIEYQLKNYDLIKEKIEKNNKLNKQYIEENEKLKQNIELKNKFLEQNKYYDMQKDLLLNKEKICKLQNNEFIELKNTELNLLKEIYSIFNRNNEYNEKEKIENEQFLLLFKVLKIIIKKYGPLKTLLNQTNSIESQRINLQNILNKFKAELEI